MAPQEKSVRLEMNCKLNGQSRKVKHVPGLRSFRNKVGYDILASVRKVDFKYDQILLISTQFSFMQLQNVSQWLR